MSQPSQASTATVEAVFPAALRSAPVDASMSDEALMQAYTDGDEAAFGILFDRFAPVLLRVVRRRVSSDDDARDIVQHTFLNMHRARRDFRQGNRLRPWLFTIAMNLVREHYRKSARRKESPLEVTEKHTPAVEASTPIENFHRRQSLGVAMQGLLDNQREVIELHWLQDKSYEEISRIVGASVAAVRVRAHRGYERLRGQLALQN